MLKKDIKYLKISRSPLKYIPIMIMASLSINILSLALPLTMKQIYSNIIINQSVRTFLLLIVGCVVALALESLLRKMKDSSSKWIAAEYENKLTTYLIEKVLSSFEGNSEQVDYNANLEKFNSISRVTNFYSTGFFQLFIDLPFMFIFLYLIFIIGGYLVLVPIFLSIIYVVIMVINSELYSKNREIQIEKNNKLISQLTETLEKIHLVKAAGLEEFQIRKFKRILKESTDIEFKINKFLVIPETISSKFSQLTLFSILIGGSYLMMNGVISFGEITACSLLGGRAISPVQSLMNLYLQHKDVKLLKERLDSIAYQTDRYSDDIPLFPEDIDGTIEIIDLKYKNMQNNLSKTISCNIVSGSFVCISPIEFLSYQEIFRKIIGKEKIDQGKILIDNLDVTEWNMSSMKGKIEYITDTVNIFNGSILDNITYFNNDKNQDAYDSSSMTGLDVLVNKMSDGFETPLESQSVNYLPAAFIQRLNLSRALLVRPRVLILDRIDESMDYETLEMFKWLLKKLKGKVTILISTENDVIKDMADYILSEDIELKENQTERMMA